MALRDRGQTGRRLADATDLQVVGSTLAAHRAAVADKHAGRIQFQGINACGPAQVRGFSAFPHDGRATAAAFHIDHFRVIALVQRMGRVAGTYKYKIGFAVVLYIGHGSVFSCMDCRMEQERGTAGLFRK